MELEDELLKVRAERNELQISNYELVQSSIRKDGIISRLESNGKHIEERLQSALNMKHEALANLRTMNDTEISLRQKIKKMESEMDQLKSEIKSKNDKLITLQIEFSQKKVKLETANSTISALSEKNQNLKSQLLHFQEQRNETVKMMNSYKEKVEARISSIEMHIPSKSELLQKLGENCRQCEMLQTYEQKLRERDSEITKLKQELEHTKVLPARNAQHDMEIIGEFNGVLKELEREKRYHNKLKDEMNTLIEKYNMKEVVALKTCENCENVNATNELLTDDYKLLEREFDYLYKHAQQLLEEATEKKPPYTSSAPSRKRSFDDSDLSNALSVPPSKKKRLNIGIREDIGTRLEGGSDTETKWLVEAEIHDETIIFPEDVETARPCANSTASQNQIPLSDLSTAEVVQPIDNGSSHGRNEWYVHSQANFVLFYFAQI